MSYLPMHDTTLATVESGVGGDTGTTPSGSGVSQLPIDYAYDAAEIRVMPAPCLHSSVVWAGSCASQDFQVVDSSSACKPRSNTGHPETKGNPGPPCVGTYIATEYTRST